MQNPAVPQFIILEVLPAFSAAALSYADAIETLLLDHQGSVVFAAPADKAEILEEGSDPRAVVALKFETGDAASAFWSSSENQTIFAQMFSDGGVLHAISVPGIPEAGLPDEPLPTVANVTIPESDGPKAFMLVQGTVSDPEPIGTYMETIIPMIIERGGVYRAWTPPEGPVVLAGEWDPQYIVLSEWPSVSEPRDFWYSDTYQNIAIPTRKPASDFTVLLFEVAS
jgi:uncharacterized protein (DUF1330 family)